MIAIIVIASIFAKANTSSVVPDVLALLRKLFFVPNVVNVNLQKQRQ
jgi:hypothetical protein